MSSAERTGPWMVLEEAGVYPEDTRGPQCFRLTHQPTCAISSVFLSFSSHVTVSSFISFSDSSSFSFSSGAFMAFKNKTRDISFQNLSNIIYRTYTVVPLPVVLAFEHRAPHILCAATCIFYAAICMFYTVMGYISAAICSPSTSINRLSETIKSHTVSVGLGILLIKVNRRGHRVSL